MKRLVAILGLFLVACVSACTTTQTVTKDRLVVIAPPDNLFVCPSLSQSDYPTGAYTQADVAELVIKLENRGDTCANSLAAIRDYVNKAQSAGKQAELDKPVWH